jgi:hypothetical protein
MSREGPSGGDKPQDALSKPDRGIHYPLPLSSILDGGRSGNGRRAEIPEIQKVDGATYEKVNTFLRKRTYVTAREWAIARPLVNQNDLLLIDEPSKGLAPIIIDHIHRFHP